tara:strand:+ start:57 stop:845 length:789 start_codon:yes stop_codon:yes gene_type:complete
MSKKITSLDNKEIKNIIRLTNKSKLRNESRFFVIEGLRELRMANSNGFNIKKIFCNSNINKLELIKSEFKSEIIEVNNEVYSKISFRKTTEGLVGIVAQKNQNIKLNPEQNNLVIIIDGIEKPGNIGAILRSCDASKVDLIIINNQKCDVYNPNVIRSSLGAIFSQKIISLENKETLSFLRKNKIRVYATSLNAKKSIEKIDYNSSCAVVVGSENLGISKFWITNSDELIKIPMLGSVDSLNVSVSTSIVMYEINRQNNFNR